jgi:hypothetical protein
MRDDLICNSELDVLELALTYIKTNLNKQFDDLR